MKEQDVEISSTQSIIEDARNGKMFILVDHEDRENEGDLVIPGQWYIMGNYEFDHSALIGHQMRKDEYSSLKKIYSEQLRILWSLPN